MEWGPWQTRKERMSPAGGEHPPSARGRAGRELNPWTDFVRAGAASDFHSARPVPGQLFQGPFESGKSPRATQDVGRRPLSCTGHAGP